MFGINYPKKIKISFIVGIIGYSIALIGFLNIFSALTPALSSRIEIIRGFFPLEVRFTGRMITALVGYALFVLSQKLLKRNKNAWGITIIILFVNIFAHIVKGFDFEEAAVSLILIIALFLSRSYFVAESDKPTLIKGIKVLIFSVIFTSFYGFVGYFLLNKHIISHTRFSLWFLDSIYFIGFSTFIYSLGVLFAPVVISFDNSFSEKEKAKRIIDRLGFSSLSPTMLLPKRNYFFSSKNDGLVVYKNIANFAVSLSSPLGGKEVLNEFINFCLRQGRKPTFWEVDERHLNIFNKKEYKFIQIGSEAEINLKDYSFDGQDKKPLRYALSKMERDNFKFEILFPPFDENTFSNLKDISDEWLELVHGSEKNFTVGKFQNETINSSNIVVIKDSNNKIIAFTNFYKYGKNNLVIDLMRHKKDIPPDTMLYLFSKLITWAKEKGYDNLSLGMVALYGLKQRTLKFIFERFNSLYNFKGLWIFKSKFKPNWKPMFLVYPKGINLVAAVLALIRADLDKGIWNEIKNEFIKKNKN
jgi:phosphatidylglycerol lysyltransferase